MKKIISLFFVAGMLSLVSCGPSAEELKALEQARLDSIAAVEAVEQARLDSIAAVEAEQAYLDSIAAVEAAKPRTTTAKKPAKVQEKAPETNTTAPSAGTAGKGQSEKKPVSAGTAGKGGNK